MKYECQIKDAEARAKIVKTWAGRIKKMRTNGTYSTTFCRKYGFNGIHLWRAKNSAPVPLWKFINRVEAAFKKEGV